ncbi:hypothetical protein [Enhygromyxa salina]|uniref:hypothetical protein n=1 Tax=Enhygromyxa salina TaxID=215803 RepID=UPI0011B246FF|nr:hypothetical protein [Enhygromyxa salina]
MSCSFLRSAAARFLSHDFAHWIRFGPSFTHSGSTSFSGAERGCLDDALDGNEQPGKDYLDCANSALRFYVQCLDGNPGCEDGWNASCTNDYTAAIAACPALPSSVQSAFDGCVG